MKKRLKELTNTLVRLNFFNGFEKTKECVGKKNFKKLATNVLQIGDGCLR